MSYLGIPPFSQTARTKTEIYATLGQTSFSIPGGYLVGYFDVYLNGIQLNSSDYTATDSSTIILNVPAALNDEFVCITYWPVSLVDTYRKSEVNTALSLKADIAGATFTGNVNTPSLNGGQLAGFRNKLINGGMQVWQRATVQTTGGYGSVDRFFFGWSSGTLSVQYGRDTQPAVGSADGKYALLTATSLSGGYLTQPIEDVQTLANQVVTLSYYYTNVSGSDSGSTPYLRQSFGSGGSSNVDTSASSDITVSYGGVNRRILTYTLPSTSGKTIGTNHFLAIIVPVSGTFKKSFYGFQLEAGAIATPFEQRSYGVELVLCQRYFEKIDIGSFYYTNGSNIVLLYYPIIFKVEKRVTPTMSLIGDTSTVLWDAAGVNKAPASNYARAASVNAASWAFTASSIGGIKGTADSGVYYTASAEI